MTRRFQTLYEIFSELNRVGSGGGAAVERGPVLLLLGGGMAAGKSTVREVIGHDDFWSKVQPCLCRPVLGRSGQPRPLSARCRWPASSGLTQA